MDNACIWGENEGVTGAMMPPDGGPVVSESTRAPTTSVPGIMPVCSPPDVPHRLGIFLSAPRGPYSIACWRCEWVGSSGTLAELEAALAVLSHVR